MPNPERTFTSLGAARSALSLSLLLVTLRCVQAAWQSLLALAQTSAVPPLPGGIDLVLAALLMVVCGFFLRHADENAQALAGGGRLLPPLTLLRLLQPRWEHPLGELWSRSDPGAPLEPLPPSRNFGLVWGLGLGLAVPIWTFALLAPPAARVPVLLADVTHRLLFIAACAVTYHFAALLAQRQDEAWERVKPSVITVPRRPPPERKPFQPSSASPSPLAVAPTPPPAVEVSAPDSAPASQSASASVPAPAPAPAPANSLTEPANSLAIPPSPVTPPPGHAPFALPATCPLCAAPLTARRCDACGAPALAGRFRIVRSLGGAGARRTLLCEAPDGARIVLKELSLAGAADAQALEAFAREARTLRELKHPQLPVYVDAFREEDGPRARLYLAYRHLAGISLQQELEGKRYTEDEVLDLVEEVLALLLHLHGLQPPLIHRDLKPANLIRRLDGSVALIDFGVARDLERTLHGGTLVGTVGYMPPEQLAGQVDITCDLYALGATALHMLTRKAPWEFMDGPELRLPALKSAPRARRLLVRMLAPRRAQRFSSAREALRSLRRIREGRGPLPFVRLATAAVALATVAALGLGAHARWQEAEARAALEARKTAEEAARAQALVQAAQARAAVVAAQAAAAAADAKAAAVAPGIPLGAASTASADAAAALGPMASWRGGQLSRAEVEASLRSLPPWLKSDLPWWIHQHVLTLVARKLLALEGERRGLGASVSGLLPAAEQERLLGSAVLLLEAKKEAEAKPALALLQAWTRVTEALLRDADLRVDEPQLFALQPTRVHGPPPRALYEAARSAELEFAAASGLCRLRVEPRQRRYGGRCEATDTLAEALLDPGTLARIDLDPASQLPPAFWTRFTDDFAEARASEDGARDSADEAERDMLLAGTTVTEATGSISTADAQALAASVEPALHRCLAFAFRRAPGQPGRIFHATVRLELHTGGAFSVFAQSDVPADVQGCARILARPELGGVGAVTWVVELQRH